MGSADEGVYRARLALATYGIHEQCHRRLVLFPLVALAELDRPGLHHRFILPLWREVTGIPGTRPAPSLLALAGNTMPVHEARALCPVDHNRGTTRSVDPQPAPQHKAVGACQLWQGFCPEACEFQGGAFSTRNASWFSLPHFVASCRGGSHSTRRKDCHSCRKVGRTHTRCNFGAELSRLFPDVGVASPRSLVKEEQYLWRPVRVNGIPEESGRCGEVKQKEWMAKKHRPIFMRGGC